VSAAVLVATAIAAVSAAPAAKSHHIDPQKMRRDDRGRQERRVQFIAGHIDQIGGPLAYSRLRLRRLSGSRVDVRDRVRVNQNVEMVVSAG
jgi:hypothetical protein